MPEFPILLGDIGGTNARFALLQEPGGTPRALARVLTADFADPVAALREVLADENPPPRSAILAVAAPVESLMVPLTNARWTIDAEAIGGAFGLGRVMLVNDYVPVAATLAGLEPGDLVALGPERPPGPGPRLALGPGTGFGAAALVPFADRWVVVSTEAGHAEFGPSNEAEHALWPAIERVGGRISAETVLSGPGLLRLYRALCRTAGEPARLSAPAEVTASLASDARAAATVALFATLLGRFAGDLALIFGATGGVYLSSGIAPDILPTLARPDGFRTAFERKAPHEAWMRKIPVFVVRHRDPALLGLATIAGAPGRFAFAHEVWTAGSERGE